MSRILSRACCAALPALLSMFLLPSAGAAGLLHHVAKVALTSAAFPTCFEFTPFDDDSHPDVSTGSCSIAPASTSSSNYEPQTGSEFDPVVGSASGSGVYGTLRARATLGSFDSDGRDYTANGGASAADLMTIDSPGLTGTFGFVDFVFEVHAYASAEPSLVPGAGFLEVENTMGVRIEPENDWGHSSLNLQSRSADITTITGPALPGAMPVEERVFRFQIRYGDPFLFTTQVGSKVRCFFPCLGAWSGVADADSTVELSVITGSVPLTVTSLDGNAYANVIAAPEPAVALLVLVGLGALGASRQS